LDNSGLGIDDTVFLAGNDFLDSEDMDVIEALEDRGVLVRY
jgi:hypothetical protein